MAITDQYIERFGDIKKDKPFSLRAAVRMRALDWLSLVQKKPNEALKVPRIQFLYIHHIFKDEEKELHELILWLQRTQHRFISYTEAHERILQNNIDQPYVVFSSDDGLRNNITAGKIFSLYGISACFFINPSVIGETNYNKVALFCQNRLHFPPVQFMNWDEVNELQKMGHEIGSHTMNHINIAATPIAEMTADIAESYRILTSRCGPQKHFAYPYGRFFHFNEAGRKAVFDAGFQSCCSAERGCHINTNHTPDYSKLLIRRDHIILDWNLNHIRYFLARNVRKASPANNYYPWAFE